MRNYETVFIMDPALSDEKAAEEISRAKSIIESAKGEVLDVQKWGKRKLAYEIKKRREGIYALIRFRGDGVIVSDLERGFRLSEPVIRFMTVVDTSPQRPEEGAETRPAEAAREEDAAPGPTGTGGEGQGDGSGDSSGGVEAAGAAQAAGDGKRSPAGVPPEGEPKAFGETPLRDMGAAAGGTPVAGDAHGSDRTETAGEAPSAGGATEPEDKAPTVVD